MTREKVMAGLECLTHVDFAVYKSECEKRDCPYKDTDCEIAVMTDAYNLLKAPEPRVMTCEDMKNAEPGTVVWCEQRDEIRTYMTPMIKYDNGFFENRFLGADPLAANLKNMRFWTSRPTEEQRKAVKWE